MKEDIAYLDQFIWRFATTSGCHIITVGKQRIGADGKTLAQVVLEKSDVLFIGLVYFVGEECTPDSIIGMLIPEEYASLIL